MGMRGLAILMFLLPWVVMGQNVDLLWAKSMGGASDDYGNSITTDASGNLYTIGYFNGTADFDPGLGIFNLTSAGGNDIFIQKLDANGNLLWAKAMGGTSMVFPQSSWDVGNSIATDAAGNVYSIGVFEGTADFDPGSGVYNLSSGNLDIFIQKLDANGNFIWARSMGGAMNDNGQAITTDASGNVYTAISFFGTADFDPGLGIFNLTSAGGTDICIQKLDPNGNFLWAKSIGGSYTEIGTSIITDTDGNVYTTGYFNSTIVDFDPGVGAYYLTSVVGIGGYDIFIIKLDPNGNFLWGKDMSGGTGYANKGRSIATDAAGNVYTTGSFQDTVDFDPNAGNFNLTSKGSSDIFIQKLSQCFSSYSTDFQTTCNSFVWIDSNTYTSNNNTATYTLPDTDGCDSIVTLDLTINNNSVTYFQTACGSYTWIDGNNYTSNNNTATYTLTNSLGCDSVVTLNLTLENIYNTDIQTTCASYTWMDGNTYTVNNNTATHTITNANGCDSIFTLDLTLLNSSSQLTEAVCDGPYVLNGQSYTTSGSYNQVLTNAAGCDSTLTLNLTVVNISPDFTVNQQVLTSPPFNVQFTNTTPNLSNYNFTWDFGDGTIVQDNNPTVIHTYAANGLYDVTLIAEQQNSVCGDSLYNEEYIYCSGGPTSILENEFHVSIHPNPTKDVVQINFGGNDDAIKYKLYDLAGKLLLENYGSKFSLKQFGTGTYLLKVFMGDHFKMIKVIKD